MASDLRYLVPKAALAFWVAFSLLMVGFAHRPLTSDGSAQQAAELASLGLTLADLCEGGEHEDHAAAPLCDACVIAAGLLLPAPAEMPARAARLALDAGSLLAGSYRAAPLYNPATPVRAPPLV